MFEVTPIELIFKIFSKLKHHELLALRCVNKFFRRIVEDYLREPSSKKQNSMLRFAIKNANLGRQFVLELQSQTQRTFRFSENIVGTSIPQGPYVGCDLKVGDNVSFIPRNNMLYRPLWGGDYYAMLGERDGTQFLTMNGNLIQYEKRVLSVWKNRMFVSKNTTIPRSYASTLCDSETGQELIEFQMKLDYNAFQRPSVLSSEPAVMFAINNRNTHMTSVFDMRQSGLVMKIPDRDPPVLLDSVYGMAFFENFIVMEYSDMLAKYDMRTGEFQPAQHSYTNFGTPIPHFDEKCIFFESPFHVYKKRYFNKIFY